MSQPTARVLAAAGRGRDGLGEFANVRDLRTQFGAMKENGISREGGHYSFDFYAELKTVYLALAMPRIPKLGT